MTKWVYSVSAERAEGRAEMRNLLGGKGANLHEMASLGLPVPPGFTITTEVCTCFYANGKTYPPDLAAQVDAAVAEVERLTGRGFGVRAAYPRHGKRGGGPCRFLPKTDEEIEVVAKDLGVGADKLRRRAAELHEFNPMLGFRGIRLAVRYPEIAEMQARAIFEGAVEAGRKTGTPVTAEIMLPVIFGRPEFDLVKPIIVSTAEAVAKETGVTVPYIVGTMIELPRAALRAGEIAESAEFFSFGTNDLTQTTLGISRDDAASFLGIYTAKGLLPADPFVTIDTEGVGELVKIAAERGRKARPGLHLGICGEHGGDPASIAFCETAHLDYVSCSPFRIPIARLAAAQAALGRKAHSTA
jgi:pyruvate,orthophosphate dikinase